MYEAVHADEACQARLHSVGAGRWRSIAGTAKTHNKAKLAQMIMLSEDSSGRSKECILTLVYIKKKHNYSLRSVP